MPTTTNVLPKTGENTTPQAEVYWTTATFLNQLTARQTDLNTIEQQTIPISTAVPDFYAEDYRPLLERTLNAAAHALQEANTELGLLTADQDITSNSSTEGDSLSTYYHEFLKQACELFKLLEDTAYTLLTKTGPHTANDQNLNADKILTQIILDDFQSSVELFSEKLQGADEILPDLIDSGNYGKWFQHNWATGTRSHHHHG